VAAVRKFAGWREPILATVGVENEAQIEGNHWRGRSIGRDFFYRYSQSKGESKYAIMAPARGVLCTGVFVVATPQREASMKVNYSDRAMGCDCGRLWLYLSQFLARKDPIPPLMHAVRLSPGCSYASSAAILIALVTIAIQTKTNGMEFKRGLPFLALIMTWMKRVRI